MFQHNITFCSCSDWAEQRYEEVRWLCRPQSTPVQLSAPAWRSAREEGLKKWCDSTHMTVHNTSQHYPNHSYYHAHTLIRGSFSSKAMQ